LRKARFFCFFKKKQDFVLFLKKTEKPHSELFLFHHAISLFSELHINNWLYLLWHSNLNKLVKIYRLRRAEEDNQ